LQKLLGPKEPHADERPSSCNRQSTVRGFDIEFYDGSNAELIAHIIEASNREFSYIVTPNVNHVVRLEANRDAWQSATPKTRFASCLSCTGNFGDGRSVTAVVPFYDCRPTRRCR